MSLRGNVNGWNVANIIGRTLVISAIVDFASSYIGWRVPWYAVTSLLTLFMYSCESDLSYQERLHEQLAAEQRQSG